MQKNPKYFFVHYSQKQFKAHYPGFFGKLQQYPRGTLPTEYAARVFIYPPLDL